MSRNHPTQASSMLHPRHEKSAILLIMLVVVVLGFLHAYWGLWCMLVNEHRRLVWYEIIALWTGDLISCFWFFRYMIRYASGRDHLEAYKLPARTFPPTLKWVLISMLVAVTVDLGHTLWIRRSEEQGFSRAVPAQFTVSSAKIRPGQQATFWSIRGTYPDAAGGIHEARFFINAREQFPLLPPPVQAALQNQNLPFVMPIVIDPLRPGRNWIPQFGWDDGNRLHYLSFLILLFQCIFGMNWMLLLHTNIRSSGIYPWWGDLVHLFPFLTEAFVFALFGGLEVYVVPRFCI